MEGEKLKNWSLKVEVLFAMECQINLQGFFVFPYIRMQKNYSHLNYHYGEHPSFFWGMLRFCPLIACFLVVLVLVMSDSCPLCSTAQKCDDTNRHREVGHHLLEKLEAGSPLIEKFVSAFRLFFFFFF